ncbi:MAG: hypothetical protein ACPKPY_07330 [Nitrososphaeraceae archaeon]
MFGKVTCKICGDEVRFALRHIKTKHANIYSEITNTKMKDIMKKYFRE